MDKPEFDSLNANYKELLRDPLRDRFTGPDAAFFHLRKRDLIRAYFKQRRLPSSGQSFLDLGCGQGDLLHLLAADFHSAAGCDPSGEMLKSVRPGIETRRQEQPLSIPFQDQQFDFVTAVCVLHHVKPADRPALVREAARVLKPGGAFCIIEHNPRNPVTRRIVSRTPVDADAILLPASETCALMRDVGLAVARTEYFLFFPAPVYRAMGALENCLRSIPFGGQYAVFGRRR